MEFSKEQKFPAGLFNETSYNSTFYRHVSIQQKFKKLNMNKSSFSIRYSKQVLPISNKRKLIKPFHLELRL